MHKKAALVMLSTLSLHQAAVGAELNVLDQLRDGGIGVLVILAMSMLFVAVTVERLVHFRVNAIVPDGLIERAQPLWAAHDFAGLQTLLAKEDSTLARVIAYLVAHRQQSHAIVSAGAGDIASIELRYQQQKSYPLAIVATVAPIVGLLGTVIGMIEAFHVIAFAEGMGNPALLAGGISKALINTASGLGLALPALAMHHFFKNRMVYMSLALEAKVNRLIGDWFMPQTPAVNLQVVPHAH